MSFTIAVGYDEAEHRYFVLNSEIPGLNVEADTFEDFMRIASDLAPQLAELSAGDKMKFEREVAIA